MPILRLNAGPHGLVLHGSPAPAMPAIRGAARGTGPVMILIHGFKYDPACPRVSPHSSIFATPPQKDGCGGMSWLSHLGFGSGDTGEGLAIAFGWRARGNLWRAARSARAAGRHLSDLIRTIRRRAPQRAIHVITHSMGSEVIFEAMQTLPAGVIGRIITLSGASYASRASHAMQTAAGRTAELFNITSRENDVFDFMYERLIAPPVRGDGAMGIGIVLPNVVNIQLDCPLTLAVLARLGAQIAPSGRRICHWSSYTRPGVLPFYARALRTPAAAPLVAMQQMLPEAAAPRWSRMFIPPMLTLTLPILQKSAS